MYTFYGFTPYIHILQLQTWNVEIVHKNVFRPCRCDILSFNELNFIKVWKQKDELLYYVAIEYLYYKIHGIHAVQGLGGINEMMVHIKKINMLLRRPW